MANRCPCCGTSKEGIQCPYCDYVEVIGLDESGDTFAQQEAANHKKQILSNLTDFSITTYQYKWNETKSRLELKKKEDLQLTDGTACYGETKWISQPFGQVSIGKDLALELNYKFQGALKQISFSIPTTQCDDFWKLGLMIDESLKLKVFLGSSKKHTKTPPLELDLK